MLEDNGQVQAIDAILINEIMEEDFPIFDLETETKGETNQRKAGDWGGTFSFSQEGTSANNENILEFFRGGTRDYKFIILMQVGGTIFHGKFNSSELDYDFTYSEGKHHVSFIARDLLEEWAIYLNTLHSDFDIGFNSIFYFEGYIHAFHLKDFNVNFIGDTLTVRVGHTVYFKGSTYNKLKETTDMRGVSRLESFKGLAKGLGFTYDLSVNTNIADIAANPSIWYPRSFMQVNIDFMDTSDTSTATELTKTMIHKERSTPKANRYLFIGYRHIISTAFPEVDEIDFTAVRGILFDGENVIAESDSGDVLNPIYARYPFFYFPPDNTSSPDGNYVYGNQFAFYDRRYAYPDKPPIFNREDTTFIDLELYSYREPGTQDLWAPGSLVFARLFTTNNGALPLHRFVVNQYKRYLVKAGKKIKTAKIQLTDAIKLRFYKLFKLTDDQGEAYYYASNVSKLNIKSKEVELELTQI